MAPRAQVVVDGFDYPLGSHGAYGVCPAGTTDKRFCYWICQDFQQNVDSACSPIGVGTHLGEDWNRGQGYDDYSDPVYAIATRQVVYAQDGGTGWGKVVILRHMMPDGITQVESLYAHLSSISVSYLGWVSRGDVIGAIGDSSVPAASHLHFEVRLASCRSWGNTGQGYSTDSTGWTDPSDFIGSHRTVAKGQLVKTSSSDAVYWLQNNRIYWVSSEAVMNAMATAGAPGWGFSYVNTVSSLAGYQQGPDFIGTGASSNGLLVRDPSSLTVFLVEGGVRRPFTIEESLRWNGEDWFPHVIEVPGSVLATFVPTTGQPIYGIGEGESDATAKQSFKDAYSRLAIACGTTSSWTGWPGSFRTCLEFPQTTVLAAYPSGVSGIAGRYQTFGNQTSRFGVLEQSARGTWGVWGKILETYQSLNYSAGPCGFPTSDEYDDGQGHRRNDFEHGYIYAWQVGGTWYSAETCSAVALPGAFNKGAPANGATGQATSLTLSWGTSSGVTNYEYCLDATNDSACSGTWTNAGSSTSVGMSGLAAGTTYYWQVRAVNAGGTTYANGSPVAYWSFATAGVTRIIGLSGDLAFGPVTVGATATRPLTISNTGTSTLTVTGITYPPGFSGVWSGTIAAGGSQVVTVTFAPTAVTTYTGTVSVASDKTSGTNTTAASGAGTGTLNPPGDFTGDGTSDLLWRGMGGDLWLWGMEDAAHATDAYVGIVADPNWEIRGQGDLNGDGMEDLLWRHKADGTVYYWEMNGNVPVHELYVSTVDTAYDIVGTEDFDGDGKADILWRSPTIGDLWLWRMNGAEVVSQHYVDTVDLSYTIKGLGDLNGDRKADVVWQGASGNLWAWLVTGAVRDAQAYVGTVADPTYELQQVADFDADLKADLLWRNAVAGDVWIWRMDGAAKLSEHYVGLVADTNYRIQAAGDYNGDGKADLLWRNIVAGDLWVWLMNGPVKESEYYVGVVADQGYQIVR